MDCVLAFDAGGTQTRCWVAQTDGTVRGCGHGGPGNHVLGPIDLVTLSFRQAADAALATAGLDRSAVRAAVAGCAGIEATGETRGPVDRILEDIAPDSTERRAVGDMIVAFRGALPEGVGVVTIAGTGAVSYGEDAEGGTIQVDGWGHIFGDDGSGYAIARAGLRAAAQAHDGRGAGTMLADSLPQALGVDTMPQAAYRVYASPNPRMIVAPLAEVVTQAARDGDEIAVDILNEAGRDLAEAAMAALFQLHCGPGPAVATIGGVFRAGDLVIEPFAQTLRMGEPSARLVDAALPPVGGAAMIACSLLGVEWEAEHVARAAETARALGG